jgi:hypothetical protein
MHMVAAWGKWAAIFAKVKLGFGTGKSINVETKGIEIICHIVRRAKINGGSKAGVSANFQQAL